MKPGARLEAAIEVLTQVLDRHRPAADALSDWGRSHRFAGSGDRAAIGNLVYDALRRRLSLAAQMGSETPRALVIAAAPRSLAVTADDVDAMADGSPHALPALTAEERDALRAAVPASTPEHVRGDIPDWLMPSFERAFGSRAAIEGEALARRAPVDMRANTLKADRDKVLKALSRFSPVATPFSPVGIRIPPPDGPGRTPNVEAEPAHGKGWFEVQDEASQLAALLTGAGPRRQIMDICAGAGGKTLAMASRMENTGQIYAYDSSRQQLRPIFERLKRAGVRNAQVLPAGDPAELTKLAGRFDIVLVDAPCTGTGVWRRRPDAKWRVKPSNLEERCLDQRRVLEDARHLVKPGGRLVYVTCSVLPEENGEAVEWLLATEPGWSVLPYAEAWTTALPGPPPQSADGRTDTLLLTPASHATDGFFIAILQRPAT